MYSIGSERIYSGYIEVKVSRSEWRWKHYLIWEAAHGLIPDGHLIRFADGNNRNFCLDNLFAVSRTDLIVNGMLKARRTKFPVGATKTDSNGYIYIKVAQPQTWVLKHYLIWEAANGLVPDGHLVYFIDGDRSNFNLDNLAVRPKRPPIGAEQVTHGGYITVKTAEPNTWRWKHYLVWEAANGPIPEGHCLCFADGNPQNCALDNLVLMTNRERGYMVGNSLFVANAEPELFKTAVNVAKLGLAINKRRMESGSRHV